MSEGGREGEPGRVKGCEGGVAEGMGWGEERASEREREKEKRES